MFSGRAEMLDYAPAQSACDPSLSRSQQRSIPPTICHVTTMLPWANMAADQAQIVWQRTTVGPKWLRTKLRSFGRGALALARGPDRTSVPLCLSWTPLTDCSSFAPSRRKHALSSPCAPCARKRNKGLQRPSKLRCLGHLPHPLTHSKCLSTNKFDPGSTESAIWALARHRWV